MNRQSPLLHRVVRVGQAFTTWRRGRLAAKDDAFVQAWKTAWTEGCHRRWQGGPLDAVPYVQDDRRAAWLAGWQWADANPDRRREAPSSARGYGGGADRRARLSRGAGGGIAALALVAAAGWWWRRRRTGRS